MPEMILHRNHHLVTTAGHAVYFNKGKKTYVPPVIVKDAVAIGAIMAEGEALDFDEPKDINLGPTDPAERQKAIFDAFERVVAHNNRDDFMASGAPSVYAVARETGWPVDARERMRLWDIYRSTRATSED